jgi:hypothetical protein
LPNFEIIFCRIKQEEHQKIYYAQIKLQLLPNSLTASKRASTLFVHNKSSHDIFSLDCRTLAQEFKHRRFEGGLEIN